MPVEAAAAVEAATMKAAAVEAAAVMLRVSCTRRGAD